MDRPQEWEDVDAALALVERNTCELIRLLAHVVILLLTALF